jgi:mannose-6-phosphate isomerase-like protein (cupin superfamily)
VRHATVLALVGVAFFAGLSGRRLMPEAFAANDASLMPMIINLNRLTDDDIALAKPGSDMRSHTYVSMPGATVSVQTGNVFRHLHESSYEIQYIVEGSGRFWLGDTERTVGPGDLIIIPKGTPHAGSIATSGRFKAIAIKTPPQAADDTHRLD